MKKTLKFKIKEKTTSIYERIKIILKKLLIVLVNVIMRFGFGLFDLRFEFDFQILLILRI